VQELSASRMDDAYQHLIPVGVYTVNTAEDLAKACKYGVRAVVSNYPDVITAAYEATKGTAWTD
jgi:glycerophosphoryl diester phosphodiesterase